MDVEQTLAEVKRYEAEFAGILSRFKKNRDGIWIGEGDDPILRQYVRESIDLFTEIFGRNNYSQQISDEFDRGITNFSGSPSYKCVENILSIVRAVHTRLNRNPVALVQKEAGAQGPPSAVKTVLSICNRFHDVARQLIQRRESRPTLEIKDEYDVQDLLHALLRIDFDDIRPEEWTPSYAGSSSRMDFLLKGHGIVVETKMTRKGLAGKEVADQLIIDVARYCGHQECKTLICLVYDPSGSVKNPRGLETDLAKLPGNGLTVICVVTP
jgi:hypothetical protein